MFVENVDILGVLLLNLFLSEKIYNVKNYFIFWIRFMSDLLSTLWIHSLQRWKIFSSL